MSLPPATEHRVLIFAPTGRDGALASDVLRRGGLSATALPSADALYESIDDDTGAVMIAEEGLSPRTVELLSSALARQPAWSDLPLIILASPLDARASTARLDQMLSLLGNVTILERPVRIATMVTSLKAALRARERQYEARKTLQQLARREEELERADQRKNQFLAMLAHELRNPMAAISMALEMWRPGSTEVERATRHREVARRQMKNLVRLVDDLLDVSRITRGVVELRKRPVDLAELVENAVASARPSVERFGHQLQLEMAPGGYPIEADVTRIEQIVANLLSNAAKYTEPPGVIRVTLSREAGSLAVLKVADTGRGIPGEMLEKVFDLFVQVDQSLDRAAGGLGLGLTLVRQLAVLHGGEVSVRSEGVGRGSEFQVSLPLSPSEGSSAAADASPVAPPSADGERQRVLVVEDSEDIRDAMKEILEMLGHDVSLAVDGREGAKRLLEVRPDVALIDVGLPGMSGYELARFVRAQPGGDRFYLVALTGYGGAEARAKAKEAGFNLHITKPLNLVELPDVLARRKMG